MGPKNISLGHCEDEVEAAKVEISVDDSQTEESLKKCTQFCLSKGEDIGFLVNGPASYCRCYYAANKCRSEKGKMTSKTIYRIQGMKRLKHIIANEESWRKNASAGFLMRKCGSEF